MFKKVKIFIQKAYLFFKKVSQDIIPIAVNIAEAVKKVIDTDVDDIVAEIVKAAIPGTADDVIIDKTKKFIENNIGEIITRLKLIESTSGEDLQARLKSIFGELKFSSPTERDDFIAKIAASVAEKMADGKLTFKEAYELTQDFYQYKKE